MLGSAGERNGNLRAGRVHNTIRERNKVQRGRKDPDTPLRKGEMLYYNFVRPHMSLEGKTPAEIAGIGIEEKNRWMGILEKALRKEERIKID